MSKVLITGATGFLGKELVQAARTVNQEVIALSRGPCPAEWRNDAGIAHVQLDLSQSDTVAALSNLLTGVTSVIHAAASFAGDVAAHARDTIKATENLIDALEKSKEPPRLVLVSSLSVYNVAAMADGAKLDESVIQLVERPEQRDAYASAKAAQEQSVGRYSGATHIIRPGAIYGPNRLWSAQLGFAKAGFVFCPGTNVLMPAIEVGRAASAIVHAATQSQGADVINLIEPDPPTRADWLGALGLKVIPVPQWLVFAVGALTGRGPGWQARFRPLKYDTSRAETILDSATYRSFVEQMTAIKHAEGNTK